MNLEALSCKKDIDVHSISTAIYIIRYNTTVVKLNWPYIVTAHYLLYRGRLRRNSTVIIFFRCPLLRQEKFSKPPPPTGKTRT